MSDGGSSKESCGKRTERLIKRTVRSVITALVGRRKGGLTLPLAADSVKTVIVIRQHNQFGDVLCTVPLLRSLSRKFTLDELAVVVSPQNTSALAGSPYVSTLINYDKLSFYRKPSLFFDFVKKLRKGYDVLLVPSNVSLSLTNDVMALFVKAKLKLGPASLESKSNRTSSVYDVAVDLRWGDRPVHQSYRNMKVAAPLGIGRESDSGELEYAMAADMLSDAESLVGKLNIGGGLKVAIHAGAGKLPNRWNVERFAALSEMFYTRMHAAIFLTEGPMDHDAIDGLAAILKVPFVRIRNRAITFVGAVLKQMDMVVTNDTGIMHLAAGVGTPTLSLFGPTDPLQWAPLGSSHRFILAKGSDINTISVDKVFALAEKVIQKN